jgi:hypothetical protein
MTVFRWADVADRLAVEPDGTRFRCARHLAEHPRDAGLQPSIALPVGQRADFRLGDLHVQDFGTHYEARVVSHAECMPLGAALGLLVGRTREAALVGLFLAAALQAKK